MESLTTFSQKNSGLLLLVDQPRTFLCTTLFSAIAMMSFQYQAVAQEDDSDLSFSGSLGVGAEYDDNVSVSELESATGESDTATNVDGALQMDWQASDKLNISTGYNLTSQYYSEYDDFDMEIHMLYGDASYDLPFMTIGANHYFANARLGGDGFLDLNRSSIYAGKLFAEQWYLRGALNVTDKEFDVFSARDAETTSASLDTFWFFNQGNSSLQFALEVADEDALEEQFSYQANIVRIRVNHDFSLWGFQNEISAGVRNEIRDYQAITPSIGQTRDDELLVSDLSWDMKLTDWLATTASLEHGNYSSRLPSADYRENRVSLGLELSF